MGRRGATAGCEEQFENVAKRPISRLALLGEAPYRAASRALRLSVRTAAFHVAKTGSIPVGRANNTKMTQYLFEVGPQFGSSGVARHARPGGLGAQSICSGPDARSGFR